MNLYLYLNPGNPWNPWNQGNQGNQEDPGDQGNPGDQGKGYNGYPTVSFHNFKSQNFKLSVSNPKSKYAA